MVRRAKTGFSRGRNREPYSKILIVCEGKKTEPNYFNGLKNRYRLNSTNVKIVGEGATPSKIVERAEELYGEEKNEGDPFDKVYCVFDKDAHSDYNKSLNKLSQKRDFYAINSVPCFEYWLLLHYRYTTGQYEKANSVIQDLKTYIRDYDKGYKNIFEVLKNKVETAKSNAKKSIRYSQEAGTDNPSTKVHILVDFLQNIRKP